MCSLLSQINKNKENARTTTRTTIQKRSKVWFLPIKKEQNQEHRSDAVKQHGSLFYHKRITSRTTQEQEQQQQQQGQYKLDVRQDSSLT